MNNQIPNIDPATGIHYGVIPSRDLGEGVFDEIESNGINIDYEDWKQNIEDQLRNIAEDTAAIEDKDDRLERFENDIDDFVSDNSSIGTERRKRVVQDMLDCFSDAEPILDKADVVSLVEKLMEPVTEEFNYEGTGDCTRYYYEKDGYVLQVAGDGDIFVIKSPFYTMAAPCSPCAPNAGYLRNEGLVKSFCLGADWFDTARDYSRCMPYACYRVDDNKQTVKKTEQVPCNICGGTGKRSLSDIAKVRGCTVEALHVEELQLIDYDPETQVFSCNACQGKGTNEEVSYIEEE